MRHLLVGFGLFLAAGALLAQSDRATITGTVTDPTGAFVANAPIQAKNVETGVVYSAASSTTGNYTIGQLPVGTYEISVAVPGFKKYLRENLTAAVQVAQVLRIDVALQVGSATESVTVTDVAPLLDTETGDLRHSVTVDRLDDLPDPGDQQPGRAGEPPASGNPNAMIEHGSRHGLSITPRFAASTELPTTRSRPDRKNRIRPTPAPGVAAQTQPSVDAIQEIAIQTSNYAAEFGQVGGGYFNLTMRSGTNLFLGSRTDYFRRQVFNAGTRSTGNPVA